MGRCWQHLLLLCLAAVVEIIFVGNPSEAAEKDAPVWKALFGLIFRFHLLLVAPT